MGASLALAGMAGCTKQPEERILPYARSPEETIPGKPLFFASAVTLGGYADGVLVESHMGRPTKIEGNPSHPVEPGRDDELRAGGGAVALRSGPLEGRHQRRPHLELAGVSSAS